MLRDDEIFFLSFLEKKKQINITKVRKEKQKIVRIVDAKEKRPCVLLRMDENVFE